MRRAYIRNQFVTSISRKLGFCLINKTVTASTTNSLTGRCHLTSKAVTKTKHELLTANIEWSRKHVAAARNLLNSLFLKKQEHSRADLRNAGLIISRWVEESKRNRKDISCDGLLGIFHQVLKSMKVSKDFDAQEAIRLLNKMEMISDETERPDVVAYSMALNIIAGTSGLTNNKTASLSEEIFLRCLEKESDDTWFWNSYLHVLSKCKLVDKSEEILGEMIRLNISDSMSFNLVLHTLANNSQPVRAQALLQRMLNSQAQVTQGMYNACIDAWAKEGDAVKAQELLDTMVQRSGKGGPPPDQISFGSVLNAWAKSRRPDAGQRAHNILIAMEKCDMKPNSTCFTAAINAWSSCPDSVNARTKSLELLGVMLDRYHNGDKDARPNITTYTSVIHVVASCRDQESAKEAENLLQHMKEIEKSGGLVVNTVAYSAVIDAIVKSNVADGHERAFKLLREMQLRTKDEETWCAPNTITYNSVIRAFTNKGKVEGARLLFNEMLQDSNQGNKDVIPDIITYASLLHGYAKQKNLHSSRTGLDLLYKLEEEFRAGKENLKPNTYVYTSAIALLATNGLNTDAPFQAEAMLKRMQTEYEDGNKDIQPNSHTLGAVLRVWFASKHPQAPERASALLSWAEGKYKAGSNRSLKSHRILYNQLLHIWAYSGRAESLSRMEDIINEMSNLGTDLLPNAESYCNYMIAIKNCKPKDGVKQQFQILRFLIEAHDNGSKLLKPTAKAVNLVLESCSHASFRDGEVLEEAKALVKEIAKLILESEDGVWNLDDSVTYIHFFDACRSISPKFECAAIVEAVYKKCLERGQINREIKTSYTLCQHK